MTPIHEHGQPVPVRPHASVGSAALGVAVGGLALMQSSAGRDAGTTHKRDADEAVSGRGEGRMMLPDRALPRTWTAGAGTSWRPRFHHLLF
jgi:hypothetical protein